MNNLITIPFHNQTLTAIEQNGKHYIAMRPIVENLGLAWTSQRIKITSRFGSCVAIIVTLDTINRKQQMLCLPISKIAGFLYSISPSKVKPELRNNIILYQEKCDQVLEDYFRGEQRWSANYYQNKYQKIRNALFAKYPLMDAAITYRSSGYTYKHIGNLIHRHPSTVSRMIKQADFFGIECHPINRLGDNHAT